MQNLTVASQDISVSSDVNQSTTSPSMSDLRGHHPQQDAYVNHTTSMTAHSFMNTGRTVWHSETNTPNGGSRYSGEWHLPLNTANNGLHREARQQDVFSGSSSPDESRDGASDDQHWKFVHGHPGDEHAHWGADHGQTKVVVGPGSATWAAPKRELDDDQAHDLQTLHPHGSLERPGHWGQHIRPSQPNLHGWPKEIGSVFTPEPDLNNVRNLFALQPAQTALSAPSVNATYTDLGTAGAGTWNLGSHLPAGPGLSALPRPLLRHDMTCHRTGTPGLYHQTPTQGYSGFQGQGREDWQTQALSPGPSGLTAEVPTEHFKISGVQRGQVCKSAILTKRGKGRGARGGLTLSASNTQNPSQVRTTLDQVRQQTHPYQIKEQKKVVRDVYPATSANVHTLKASHIVSWYIDYLIHENEHLTQISRAFSLPVNLFHSDDFYFMDSLKKKVHFPSLKFLSWMQQNLPSINVNAIDFHEGRPPVMSTWNQDWFWQNKSRRDIIHDVFFYFQHRRVTCEN
ncbi:unnamed protein product [Lymnaea stagnalis]|uniref:Uncharacterized protein n=1 Tax=Lymnaea stagnalis TaxID=6523 RepID=A0AAV2HHN8_LYMST